MKQLDKLREYLEKLGIRHELTRFNTDRFFKGLTAVSVPYMDANGEPSRVQCEASVCVRQDREGIADFVVANLYYVETEDGFVDPDDCSPERPLMVMDAWESARYIAMECLDVDETEAERLLESRDLRFSHFRR